MMLQDNPVIQACAEAPRRVIFNADDFGLSVGVNAGIIAAHRNGPVRSASLMVTTPGFPHALELTRHNPTLDLGLHLALTGVPPALPPNRVPSLVLDAGRFPPLNLVARRLARRAVDPDDVRAELRAQIERALATGLRFSHLDSHHHVHAFPQIAPIIAELACEYGFRSVRQISGMRSIATVDPSGAARRMVLRLLARSSGSAFNGFRKLDAFRGVPFPLSIRRWQDELHSIPPGLTEFVCHPGLTDPAIAPFDTMIEQREIELRWLCDPALTVLLEESGIVLTSFAELETDSSPHQD